MSEADAGIAWMPVAAASLPGEGCLSGIVLDGRRLALARVEGKLFAVGDACPHMGAPLSGGGLVGHFIECPGHYALFDLRDGRATGGFACRDLTTYPVRETDGEAVVGLPRGSAKTERLV